MGGTDDSDKKDYKVLDETQDKVRPGSSRKRKPARPPAVGNPYRFAPRKTKHHETPRKEE